MIVFPGTNRSVDIIDMRDTMYPTYAVMTRTTHYVDAFEIGWATMFGFSFGNSTLLIGKREYNIKSNQYFSIPVRNEDVTIDPTDDLFTVFRLGFIGHDLVGTQDVTKTGKLSYIDGCSDSLMVYPPRLGDPTLNYLFFPTNINQSFHTHPSLRIGCVIAGEGVSETDHEVPLTTGTFFCLEEHELHRFKTKDKSMRVIAYHPDGDWGPTDENHTMLNRTYIKK
jgi:hypothetical protein